MNPVNASRTTSASDRRSEKAIARSASCCSASIAAKSVTGAESFLSPTRARRDAPALVARSVFIADLLFADDQVLDRADELQVDGLLPEALPQNSARVGAQPLAGLRCVRHVDFDQGQHVSVDEALIPPEPSRRIMTKDKERTATEPAGNLVGRVEELPVLHRVAVAGGIRAIKER